MCQRGAAAQLFSQKKHKIGYRFMSSQQVCQHGLGRGSLMLIIQENTLFIQQSWKWKMASLETSHSSFRDPFSTSTIEREEENRDNDPKSPRKKMQEMMTQCLGWS